MDVAVEAVPPDSFDDAVPFEHGHHAGLHPGKPEADLLGCQQVVDLGDGRGSLRIDEVDSLEIEDDRAWLLVSVGEPADPILERLGSGKEEAPVEPHDPDPLE